MHNTLLNHKMLFVSMTLDPRYETGRYWFKKDKLCHEVHGTVSGVNFTSS